MNHDVPDEDAPTTCPECERPLPDERLLALHRGFEHYDALDEAGRERFEAAYRDEGDDLRLFRLQALAVLVLLYFGFLFAYAAFA
jgi:hypothetical protein